MVAFFTTIKTHKLLFSFVVIIVLFFSFGVVGIAGLFNLGAVTRTMYEHPLVVSNASLVAALNITKMHRDMKDVVLTQLPEELDAVLEGVAKTEHIVYEQLTVVETNILGEEGLSLERETRKLFTEWKPIRKKVVHLLRAGKRREAVSITQTIGAQHVGMLEQKMLELTAYARDKADGFIVHAEDMQHHLERVMIVLMTAGVFFSILIAVATTYFTKKAERGLHAEKAKLEKALAEIKTLRGIIPICSHCKQIRDDAGAWNQLERYIDAHSEAEFSHSICPTCFEKHYAKPPDSTEKPEA